MYPQISQIRRLAIADLEVLQWEGTEGTTPSLWERVPAEELTAMQFVKPVTRVEEPAANVWESLEAFSADVYAARTVDWERRGA